MAKDNICTEYIIKYAETKVEPIKRNPADNGAGDERIHKRIEELREDFNNECKKKFEEEQKKIDEEYKIKGELIPLQKNKWEAEARKKRFESTDEEMYGKEGIKISFQYAYNKATTNAEDIVEEQTKEAQEKQKAQQEEDLAKKEAQSNENFKEKINKFVESIKGYINSLNKEDVKSIAKEIGKKYDNMLKQYEAEKQINHEIIENEQKSIAYMRGEELAINDIQEYNNKQMDTANSLVKNMKKMKAQAEIDKK